LNPGNVSYTDSTGPGELVSALTTAGSQSVALKLCNLSAKVRGLLQLTRLYAIFEDEASQIASFQ